MRVPRPTTWFRGSDVASAVSADFLDGAAITRCAEDSARYSVAREFVSVAIGNRKSKIEILLAGVVQW